MRHQPLRQRTTIEGRVPRQQEVQGASQAVNIGTTVDLVTVDGLFWRDVVGGPKDFFVVLDRERMIPVVEEPGQPQIEDLDDSGRSDEQVARLDIAMDETRLVGMIQTECRLPHVFRSVREWHRTFLLNHFEQVLPPHELHRQKMNIDPAIGGHVDIIGSHDVRMVEGGDGLRLAVESTEVAGVGDALGGQDLQGAEPLHHRVLGQEDRTHPAFAQERQQAIPTQEEPLVLALEYLLRLPHCQDFLPDQKFGEQFGVCIGFGGGAELLQRRVQLHFREQVTPLNDSQK